MCHGRVRQELQRAGRRVQSSEAHAREARGQDIPVPFVPRSVLATSQPAYALDEEAQGDGHAGVAGHEVAWSKRGVPGVALLMDVNYVMKTFAIGFWCWRLTGGYSDLFILFISYARAVYSV